MTGWGAYHKHPPFLGHPSHLWEVPWEADRERLDVSRCQPSWTQPCMDAEVMPMDEGEIAQAYDMYRQRYGDFPTPDSDVSKDQLSALRQLLMVGAVPYTDFSLWGPFGQRLLRKQTYTAYQLNPTTGDWLKKEQPGPSSFHEWSKCWKIFRTGMLLLEACDAERLDSYSEMVRNFVGQFGEEAWSFISRADTRLRSEHLDRIRRELRTAAQNYGYQEAHPWAACFAAAVRDSDFWQRELTIPATLFLSRNKRSEAREPGSPPPARGEATKKRRALRRHAGDDLSKKGSDGKYTHNRKGIEICRLYGEGKCGSSKAQGKCRNNRSHQCDVCLGPHPSSQCPKGN